jgi:hypothetical protein
MSSKEGYSIDRYTSIASLVVSAATAVFAHTQADAAHGDLVQASRTRELEWKPVPAKRRKRSGKDQGGL